MSAQEKIDPTAGYLAPDLVVNGRVHGEGAIEIAGRMDGPVEVDGHVLVSGHLLGLLRARQADVRGVVEGDVTGTEVRISSGGRVIGDVRAARITLDDGGILDGSVEMDVQLPESMGAP
ncbi:MAG: cytoskeletal protein CcmA (bactofilin family) [Polyangiales bacterium]